MTALIHRTGGVLGSMNCSEEQNLKKSGTSFWKELARDVLQRRYCEGSMVCSLHPEIKQKLSEGFLWIDGCHNVLSFCEDFAEEERDFLTQAHKSEHCGFNSMANWLESPATAFVSLSQDLDRCHALSCDESASFIALLKVCTRNKDLSRGSSVHDDIVKRGLLFKCSDALVAMYAKCGAVVKAKELLDMHKSKDVIAWTTLISAYSRQGRYQDALQCFDRMCHEDLSPDAVTFSCAVRACASIGAINKGMEIHDQISAQGLLVDNIVLGNVLMDMYVKCGDLAKAQVVLEELSTRDVVSWNTLITGYVQQDQGETALNCFERMRREGISPNAITYIGVLKACGILEALEKGEQIDEEICREGLLADDVVLGNALVDMYVKCGVLANARRVLEELPFRNVVSWSTLIAGYASQGQGEQALSCFECMQHEGIAPNAITFGCVLKACGILRAVEKGKQIHGEIYRQGLLGNNVVLGNALVDMYAKCGDLGQAQLVLQELSSRDIFSWNALITGYAQQGESEQALRCFEQMEQEGLSPDAVTFASALKACGALGAAEVGRQIHDEIAKQGLLGNDIVLGSALVDMYAKCGALAKAQQVLDELRLRNVVCWSALIAGYAQQGQGEQALTCFTRMRNEGVLPNAVTYISIINACGALGAAEKGEQVHEEVVKHGFLHSNKALGNAVVDMYAKCGALTKAQEVLEELPSRDVVSWNALIAGYAQQGQGEQALNCFKRMQQEAIVPDAVTFSCVLNVCSHLGLVEDGYRHFVDMNTKYGVKPDLDMYMRMIDLFGRAGHLEKAVGVIEEIPLSEDPAIWLCLLGACLKWGDVNVGRWAFEQAVQKDRTNGLVYVLMANTYVAAGMTENAKDIEAMRLEHVA